MIVSFQSPTFFAPADEDQFFGWLYSLPEYENVRGKGTVLDLHLASPVSADTVQQLLVVFHRWSIDPEPLLPLRSRETAHLALWDSAVRKTPARD